MVNIDYKIVITGIFCLTIIYCVLIFCNHDTQFLGTAIVGAIALSIGIVIPSPKVDNKRGVLIW
jgi:uncharacterized membrane protein (DUF485 family)